MDARDQILKQIDERQEEWLRLLSELVRRPSENPPGDTRAAADCVVEHLKRQGYAPEVIEPRPGMVNVVAATDRGSGRSVILNGHLGAGLLHRDGAAGQAEVRGPEGVGHGVSSLVLVRMGRQAGRGAKTA